MKAERRFSAARRAWTFRLPFRITTPPVRRRGLADEEASGSVREAGVIRSRDKVRSRSMSERRRGGFATLATFMAKPASSQADTDERVESPRLACGNMTKGSHATNSRRS